MVGSGRHRSHLANAIGAPNYSDGAHNHKQGTNSEFRCSTNQHSSRRSDIPSCWTTVVEQPSVQLTTVRPYPSSVPPGVKEVFVWLTETPAFSNFRFQCAIQMLLLTYLLTNLLTYSSPPLKFPLNMHCLALTCTTGNAGSLK